MGILIFKDHTKRNHTSVTMYKLW